MGSCKCLVRNTLRRRERLSPRGPPRGHRGHILEDKQVAGQDNMASDTAPAEEYRVLDTVGMDSRVSQRVRKVADRTACTTVGTVPLDNLAHLSWQLVDRKSCS